MKRKRLFCQNHYVLRFTFYDVVNQISWGYEPSHQKLKQRSRQTNRSLEEELLTAFVSDAPLLPTVKTEKVQAYNEVIEFLSSSPSATDIVHFQLSDEARHRAQTLSAKERTRGLNSAETEELNFYVELGDFLGVLRAKAMLRLREEYY